MTALMRIAALACCLVLLAARAAHADRATPPTRCQVLSRSDVVFVGTVQSVKAPQHGTYETSFLVGDVVRGQIGKTTLVHMRGFGQECEPGLLVPGEKLLISASVDQGSTNKVLIAACRETRRLEDATDDAAFARGVARQTTGTLEGWIWLHGDPTKGPTPRANVELRARGTSYSTRTKADGFYRLQLPPGNYQIELVDPDPRRIDAWAGTYERSVEISKGQCAMLDFRQIWNGRIRGRLVDHRGKPAAGVRVVALDLRQPIPTAPLGHAHPPIGLSDAQGNFEITRTYPGKFLVAVSVPFDPDRPVPSTYYPGVAASSAARTVEVAPGKVVTGIDFKLRAPQPLHAITGTVRSKGSAATHGSVRISNASEQRSSHANLELDGRFRVREAAGAEVTLQACREYDGQGTCGPPLTFTIGGDREVSLELPD